MIVYQPGDTLEFVEKRVILKALAFYGWNITHTASSLGVSSKTIENKIKNYDMQDDVRRYRKELQRANKNP